MQEIKNTDPKWHQLHALKFHRLFFKVITTVDSILACVYVSEIWNIPLLWGPIIDTTAYESPHSDSFTSFIKFSSPEALKVPSPSIRWVEQHSPSFPKNFKFHITTLHPSQSYHTRNINWDLNLAGLIFTQHTLSLIQLCSTVLGWITFEINQGGQYSNDPKPKTFPAETNMN